MVKRSIFLPGNIHFHSSVSRHFAVTIANQLSTSKNINVLGSSGIGCRDEYHNNPRTFGARNTPFEHLRPSKEAVKLGDCALNLVFKQINPPVVPSRDEYREKSKRGVRPTNAKFSPKGSKFRFLLHF